MAINHNYTSCFSEYIQGMLAARNVLGYAKEPYTGALHSFDQYCLAFHPDCKEFTEHLAMSWVLGDNGDTKGVQGRARAIFLLAQYMNLSGREAYVLPERYFGNPKPKEVYMFTDDELSRLFSAIDALPESNRFPYSQHMLPVMFRLIYTCGLHPQERRELHRRNINFQTGEILITNTKKKKVFYEDNLYFFPGSVDGPLDGAWLNRQFQKCWRLANLDIPKENLPHVRIYSLRHRFASANLNRWMDEQKDLTAMLPRIRAFMNGYAKTAHMAYPEVRRGSTRIFSVIAVPCIYTSVGWI